MPDSALVQVIVDLGGQTELLMMLPHIGKRLIDAGRIGVASLYGDLLALDDHRAFATEVSHVVQQ